MCDCGHHDRLDQVLDVSEYTGMVCGTLGYKLVKGAGEPSIARQPNGDPVLQKKYCCFDCPTLIESHR